MNIQGVSRLNKIIESVVDINSIEFQKVIYINYAINCFSKKYIFKLLKNILGRRIIILHWVGSDVYTLMNNTIASKLKIFIIKFLSRIFNLNHWVAAPLLKEELSIMGIESEIVFFPGQLVKKVSIKDLNNTKEFITYLPSTNHEFYGSKLIFELAQKRPDIIIHVVANDGENMFNLENIIFHGYVSEEEMDFLYNKCRAVIRIPKHDALGGTVLEAVIRGRYAIWSFESPYSIQAKNYKELEDAVNMVLEKENPNFEGAMYVEENFCYEKLISDFHRALKTARKSY